MIGLDTNILVRIYARDDAEQREAALRLIDGLPPGEKALVSTVVVVELVWVLKRAYRFEKEELARVVRNLSDHSKIQLVERDLMRDAAHRLLEEGGDFSDHVVALTNRNFGADTTYTFDQLAAQTTDFTLLVV